MRQKIHHIKTNKLIVMVDVSRREYNKYLRSQKELESHQSEVPEALQAKVSLWKKRYALASAELTRRVNDKFSSLHEESESE